MSKSFELSEVEWATVGTIGEPGRRTFYLQVRQERELITLKLEKQQVAAVVQFLADILSDLPGSGDTVGDEGLELVEPVTPEWAVGTLQIAYDSAADRIVIVAEELTDAPDVDEEDEEDDDESIGGLLSGLGEGDHAIGRVGLTRTQAAGIVRRGWELVQAGRPTCGLCGRPIDPEGHMCPRTNGHREATP